MVYFGRVRELTLWQILIASRMRSRPDFVSQKIPEFFVPTHAMRDRFPDSVPHKIVPIIRLTLAKLINRILVKTNELMKLNPPHLIPEQRSVLQYQ